jgi:uncharacterized protein
VKLVIALLAGAAIGSILAVPCVGAQPVRPSFNCDMARTADERAICGDERLAELDQAIAIAFSHVASKSRDSARAEAKDILAARRSCGANQLCILDKKVNGIETFSALGSQVPVPPWVGDYRLALFKSQGKRPTLGIPTHVAQCALTKIAAITTRFGDELTPPASDMNSSGSAVGYANGGRQVSYEYVAPLAESRIGDEVLFCLVSIPKDCPPGDERGRVYSATNLRTKGSWLLPDAQHMCGGA